MMLLKHIVTLFIKPLIAWYLKKDRHYNYDGFKLIVYAGVFHPQFFFSTKYFYAFIKKQNVTKKACLEIGCGSGLLSLLLHKNGGNVTGIDINEKAVLNTQQNFKTNCTNNNYTIVKSNLFENITGTFDVIIINPPYFFNDATSDEQQAWYCGKNGEYFNNLFSNLKYFLNTNAIVYMVLADNCDLKRIGQIANKHNCELQLIEQKKFYWETNYIYKITY